MTDVKCVSSDVGTGLYVLIDQITPQASGSACASWNQSASGQGSYWATVADVPGSSPVGATEHEICSLSNVAETLTVYDSGGAINGTAICGNLVHAGWTGPAG